MTDIQLQTILISVVISSITTWICFLYYLFNYKEKKPTIGSQIPPMRSPPPPPKRKEPIQFTPDQVQAMIKQRKKDKIKSLEDDVQRWRNMFFQSEDHISELKRTSYGIEPEKCVNKEKHINDIKLIRMDEKDNIIEVYSLNKQNERNEKDRLDLIREIEQELKKVHDTIWDTPLNSKLSERFISAMNKQNSAILKLVNLCKQI